MLFDCIRIATDIATSCWAADEAGFSIFHFRPRSSSVWTCGTRSTGPLDGHFYISMFVEVLYFQPPLWWQWTYFKYNRIFAAISLVAMNLQSNIFQPSLGWQWTYNRILFSHLFGGIVESVRWQSELCTIHISLVAHLSIWLVAQNFQCPRNFCVFCGSIFRHRQATLLTLISLKRETRKSKDLQHVVTFAQTKTCSIF